MPCKHILNAQTSIQAPCCLKWFDCSECHDEYMDHQMGYSANILFACHSCKLSFRKDFTIFGDKDETCPHCDNRYVIPARTPESELYLEGVAELDKMLETLIEYDKTIVSSSEMDSMRGVVDEDSMATFSVAETAESISEREILERRKSKIAEAKKRRQSRNKG